MTRDESENQTGLIEEFESSEILQSNWSDNNDILCIISKFLETAGNVLLIQGPPGSGKTTLALELLGRVKATRMGRTEIPPTRLYVQSRVSPQRLRKHFPWLQEMHDPFSKKTENDESTDTVPGIRVSEADDVFNKILTTKRSKLRGLMVIDSWEGALRNTSDDGRRMIESALLSDPDDNRVGVVLVSEGGRIGDLPNLVDGIVTLSSSELTGRRLRTIAVNKLRGVRIKSDRALFSLDKGKFNLLANTRFENGASTKPSILSPVSHSPTRFSTGSRDLDLMLRGGISKGSSILMEVNGTVPTIGVRLLLRIIIANFVNQGDSAFVVPFSTLSSDSVAESLRLLVGDDTLKQRIRIAEYNQDLPRKKWRVQLNGKVMDDFAIFNNIWKELATPSSSIILALDFDRIVQIYGEDLMLPSLANMGASMRDSGAVTLAVASEPSKVRDTFLRTADYYLKVDSINDTMVLYGVKPFTNVHGVEFGFDKGYPSLKLTEIV
ncbi:MAG TPA: ATPase domain-containing protein [Candidatus Angelobacter sp.]|nr:ATPase domain-containing protein [Candidatus Angelobacter sp.]